MDSYFVKTGVMFMISKYELVQNLKNVKLVIGNGFDLNCGLKTKYADFFDSLEKTNEEVSRHVENYKNTVQTITNYNKITPEFTNPFKLFSGFGEGKLDNINTWYMLFLLVSKKEKMNSYNWCNIESVIYESLKEKPINIIDFEEIPSFPTIYSLFKKVKDTNENIIITKSNNTYILTSFIHQKYKKIFESEFEFYTWLLDELYDFEKEFGIYIQNVHSNDKNYPTNSENLIKKICKTENIKGISTFNYDGLGNGELDDKLQHINGDIKSPIFGIDSQRIKPAKPAYLFTKINRRLLKSSVLNEIKEEVRFDNLIIYGHSLDEADYSFFFVEFDRLNITDINCSSKIVFAYSIYDENKRKEIELHLFVQIEKLFYKYSMQKNSNIDGSILLEKLYALQRVILYEVR